MPWIIDKLCNRVRNNEIVYRDKTAAKNLETMSATTGQLKLTQHWQTRSVSPVQRRADLQGQVHRKCPH